MTIELGRWADRDWVGPAALESAHDIPRVPGLYALVAFQQSNPARIPRFLGIDPTGLVYIGKATRLRGRTRALARSYLEGKPGHMAGRNFERVDLLRIQAGLSAVKTDFDLRLYYSTCASPPAAERAETDLLHSYMAMYGEVPPMNAQGSWREIS